MRALRPFWFVVTKPIKKEYIFITLKRIRVRKHFITIDREARERECEDREKNRIGRTWRRGKARAKELEGRLKPNLEQLKVKGKGDSSISSNKLEFFFFTFGS